VAHDQAADVRELVTPAERDRALRLLERLMELLEVHRPASGALRLRLDRNGALRASVAEISFDGEGLDPECQRRP
jgi:hypothetical protein